MASDRFEGVFSGVASLLWMKFFSRPISLPLFLLFPSLCFSSSLVSLFFSLSLSLLFLSLSLFRLRSLLHRTTPFFFFFFFFSFVFFLRKVLLCTYCKRGESPLLSSPFSCNKSRIHNFGVFVLLPTKTSFKIMG